MKISTTPRRLPNRIVLHALEGWGKTSFAAQIPHVCFAMTGTETGLWTLMQTGCIPETPHFEEPLTTWEALKTAVMTLPGSKYAALALDTLNGAERLCQHHVCLKHFGGDWTETGYASYGRGHELAAKEWASLLSIMDTLRAHSISVIALCHSRITTFKNPTGPDYDRYTPALQTKTWEDTHRWADMILFGQFETFFAKRKKVEKTKVTSTQNRILFTERTAAYDAKNRHGLPPEINCGDSAAIAWQTFRECLLKASNGQTTNKGSQPSTNEQETTQ